MKICIKEIIQKVNEKINPVVNFFYDNRRVVTVLGFTLFSFPFISLLIAKYNVELGYDFYRGYSENLISFLMFLGIFLLYSGLILFGYKIEENMKFRFYVLKIIMTGISAFAMLLIDHKNMSDIGKTIFIICYIWLLFLIINELIKIIINIFIKFKDLKSATQVSIVLSILAAIISYIFKIEIKF